MNRDQLIERLNSLYPDQDPAAVYDWASEATTNDTDPVPVNFVYEMCVSLARDLGLQEHERE